MDSHLLFSFYYFVCLSGYLKSCEKSRSALQSSHCSSATDAAHKVKANTKTTPNQNPFFFSQGREGEHIRTSLSCSSRLPAGEQPRAGTERAAWLHLRTREIFVTVKLLNYYSLDQICSPISARGSVRDAGKHPASSEEESVGA